MDPKNGYCPDTKTFQSLRPSLTPPPASVSLTPTSFARPKITASSLQARYPFLSPNDVFSFSLLLQSMFPLCVPPLPQHRCFPANPLSSSSELTHMVQLCKPLIAFATSSTAGKLPSSFPHGTILLDSPEFLSMIQTPASTSVSYPIIRQSDSAAIRCSSGTTGKVKGVELTHRNLIALTAGLYYNKFNNAADEGETTEQEVSFMTLPLFSRVPDFHAD
ncbi:hypothetical protein HAX54_009530 [Datura stramonium]|uniref:AMP-dependent synthetase/ligase domain-containing protein n=1 Tax=Datura stramonium TaxID=4076 RepID=A0ABS8RWJ1_DATST|nr:hypothetical protein [Datura stramonium]